MHHQGGVHFENFTEVKFRDILLTGKGHRDRRLNWDSSGQTGTYGRSNLNQNLKPKPNFRFIRERPFAIPSFHQKCRPPPPLVGALGTSVWNYEKINPMFRTGDRQRLFLTSKYLWKRLCPNVARKIGGKKHLLHKSVRRCLKISRKNHIHFKFLKAGRVHILFCLPGTSATIERFFLSWITCGLITEAKCWSRMWKPLSPAEVIAYWLFLLWILRENKIERTLLEERTVYRKL